MESNRIQGWQYDETDHTEYDVLDEWEIGDLGDDGTLLIPERSEIQSKYNPNGTNTIYTVFLIVNGTLGGALLNFPKAFDDGGGIVAACIVQFIVLIFVMIALFALIYAADQCKPSGAETIQVEIITNYIICRAYD